MRRFCIHPSSCECNESNYGISQHVLSFDKEAKAFDTSAFIVIIVGILDDAGNQVRIP
jgi:hypothetical protein